MYIELNIIKRIRLSQSYCLPPNHHVSTACIGHKRGEEAPGGGGGRRRRRRTLGWVRVLMCVLWERRESAVGRAAGGLYTRAWLHGMRGRSCLLRVGCVVCVCVCVSSPVDEMSRLRSSPLLRLPPALHLGTLDHRGLRDGTQNDRRRVARLIQSYL